MKKESDILKSYGKTFPETVQEGTISVESFVEKNFYILRNLYFMEDRLETLRKSLSAGGVMLGVLDVKKISSNIAKLEDEKRKALDLLIDQLDCENGKRVIPKEDQIFNIFSDLYDRKEGGFSDEDYEDDDTEDSPEDEEYIEDHGDDEGEEESHVDIASMIKERMREREDEEKSTVIDEEEPLHTSSNEERQRLVDVRRAIVRSGESAGGEDVFDPQEGLENIRKVNNLSEDRAEKRRIKKIMHDWYKGELGKQLIGMGKINTELERILSESATWNSSIEREKFLKSADEYRLSQWQRERYLRVLNEVDDAVAKVDEFLKNNNGMEPGKMLEKISGHSIRGKVEMERLPLAVVFHCFESGDFSRTFSGEDDDIENEENIEENEHTLGRHMLRVMSDGVGVILLNRSKIEGAEILKGVLDHENRHAIYDCINSAQIEADLKFDEMHDPLLRLMNHVYDEALRRGKDEALAFIKGGAEDPFEAYLLLAVDGGYEFFNDEYLKSRYEESEELRNFKWSDVLDAQGFKSEKYRMTLMDSMVAIEELRQLGFKENNITGLLQHNGLDMWKKVLERFLEARMKATLDVSAEDISEVRDHIKECIKTCEVDNDRYEKYLNTGTSDEQEFADQDVSDPDIREYYEVRMVFNNKLKASFEKLIGVVESLF